MHSLCKRHISMLQVNLPVTDFSGWFARMRQDFNCFHHVNGFDLPDNFIEYRML